MDSCFPSNLDKMRSALSDMIPPKSTDQSTFNITSLLSKCLQHCSADSNLRSLNHTITSLIHDLSTLQSTPEITTSTDQAMAACILAHLLLSTKHAEDRMSILDGSSKSNTIQWSALPKTNESAYNMESSESQTTQKKITRRRQTTKSNVNQSMKKERKNHPLSVRRFLTQWLLEHRDCPYPTEMEKKSLMSATGLNEAQINDWMVNARRRVLRQSGLIVKKHQSSRRSS